MKQDDRLLADWNAAIFNVLISEECIFGYNKTSWHGSTREIFAMVLDEFEEYPWPSSLLSSGKSEAAADKLRAEGNCYYRIKKFDKALELYNRSIMVAPHPVLIDEERDIETTSADSCLVFRQINLQRYGGVTKAKGKALAKGFANRSAIMLELDLFDKCLYDIDLALEYGYPKELTPKLEERRQRCLAAKYQASMDKGTNKNQSMMLSNKSAQVFESICKRKSIDPKLLQSSMCDSVRSSITTPLKKTPLLEERNEAGPSLSSAIKVFDTQSYGRGLVAQRDIRPGEVLAIEKAYSISLKEDVLAFYCSNCVCLCLIPLPCPGCSKVIFCSKTCRRSYLLEEHWIECKILPTLSGIKKLGDPYKLLKTFTFSELKAVLNRLCIDKKSTSEQRGCDSDGVYRSESYQAVHYLETNEEKKTYNELQAIARQMYVSTKLLQHSNRFFVDEDGKPYIPKRDDLLLTGTVLITHIHQLQCNQHCILNNSQDASRTTSSGSGLFPTLSLVNHSCYPNSIMFFYKRIGVIKCRRPIAAGEEITSPYTKTFSNMSKEARKLRLKYFNIDCTCLACKYNWPTYDYLPPYMCIYCSSHSHLSFLCYRCLSEIQKTMGSEESRKVLQKRKVTRDLLQEALLKVQLVKLKMKKDDEVLTADDITTVIHSTELLYKYVPMPCQILCDVDNLLDCLVYDF